MPSIIDILRHILSSRADAATGWAIDVGAHVGKFSKELIDSGLFDGVVAFEPNPTNVEELSQLAAHEPSLTVVTSAVAATPEESCSFQCDENTSTGSLLPYHQDYVNDGPVRQLSVRVVTLDAYRASAGLAVTRIGLIKIDTQGHDLAVIRGASKILSVDRPLAMAELIYMPMYVGQAQPEEISSHMAMAGYRLHTLFNIHATIEGRVAFADALFVPEEIDVPQSQRFVQLDDHASLRAQIRTLEGVCRERLLAINVLDAEVKRLSR